MLVPTRAGFGWAKGLISGGEDEITDRLYRIGIDGQAHRDEFIEGRVSSDRA